MLNLVQSIFIRLRYSIPARLIFIQGSRHATLPNHDALFITILLADFYDVR